jgi:hypothetical protein
VKYGSVQGFQGICNQYCLGLFQVLFQEIQILFEVELLIR